jgi:hypothetical protein
MDDIDLIGFLSGNMSDPAAGAAGALQNDAWNGGNVSPQPMVSPYPQEIDPATAAYSNMLGASQPASPKPAGFPQIGGGGSSPQTLRPAQPMQVGAGGDQSVNYPGQPQAATSIGKAGKAC